MLMKEKGVWNAITVPKPTSNSDKWDKMDEKAQTTIALTVEDDQIQHSYKKLEISERSMVGVERVSREGYS